MMAASKWNLLSGCRVTSVARSGFLTISTKLYFSLSARYSGRYRPACLITQRGGRPLSLVPFRAELNSSLPFTFLCPANHVASSMNDIILPQEILFLVSSHRSNSLQEAWTLKLIPFFLQTVSQNVFLCHKLN